MTALSLRERLKWRICHAGGNSDKGCIYNDSCKEGCRHPELDAIADEAFDSVTSFLTDHGLAIVPVDSTSQMFAKGTVVGRTHILAHAGALALLGMGLVAPADALKEEPQVGKKPARVLPPIPENYGVPPTNGRKEIARRQRQIAKGMLKVKP